MIDDIQRIALETLEMNKQALIFLPSRASAEKTAEDIAKLTALNHPEIEKNILAVVSSPTKQCRKLSLCVKKGIAFHHSGLVSSQREIVEDEFKKGNIRIICATPTLAAGVNLPAFRVIIKSLKRYNEKWGMDWIPVLEYLQMAGRAGRPDYEKSGEAIAIAKDEREKEEIHERYVCGDPEEIYSKLAVEPVLRTYLLALISSGLINDHESMMEFFSKTFWAFQFKDMAQLEKIMDKMLKLLKDWQFVTISGDGNDRENGISGDEKSEDKNRENGEIDTGFVSASNLLNKKKTKSRMRATFIGKRISELYLDPLTAKHLLDCLQEYNRKVNDKEEEDNNNNDNNSTNDNHNSKSNNESPDIFSLLQMITHTLEIRPLLSVKAKEHDTIQEEFNKRYGLLLEREPSPFDLEYGEFMNSIKTALFLQEWCEEKEEDFLLEKYDIRPGEIRFKLDTADWLLYAAEELSKIVDNKKAVRELVRLRIRVKNGVKEELLPLLKLKGIGRVRARRMFGHGIKNLGDVKKIDLATLSQILGKAIGEDVKKQVGEEVEEIPAGRRKGQLSMEKY